MSDAQGGLAGHDDQRKAAIDRLKAKRAFWQGLAAYIIVNAFLVGVWFVSGRGYFWPAWVMLGWGIGVVMHAWAVFGQKPITEDDIDREMRRGGGAAA